MVLKRKKIQLKYILVVLLFICSLACNKKNPNSIENIDEKIINLDEQIKILKHQSEIKKKQRNSLKFEKLLLKNKNHIEKIFLDFDIAKIKKPRKVLIYSRTTGFRHSSIEAGIIMLKLLGEKTGAFSAIHTEDEQMINDNELKKYDALIMLNTTGNPISKPESRKAFEKYISSEKGLVGIHAATDCHRDWPNYIETIGGLFDGHPWGKNSYVTIYNEDTEHPCAYMVPQGFVIRDEIYQFKEDQYFTRNKMRVLLSLDLSGPEMINNKMKRKDNDYPISWLKSYMGSKVFYTNLGHNEETYINEVALQHILSGIQFACGDLDADVTPSAKIGNFSKSYLGSKIDKDPDVTPLSPRASKSSIKIEKPFVADIIAHEPMINEPITMAWGGDGALYVVELRGYMQDLDHTGAQNPVGQVIRLEDLNNDGIMDKHTVFVDKLVEPRAIMAIKGGILVAAPPNVFFCKDTDGDGKANIIKSIYDSYASRSGNVEHKENGLMWGIDNWIYNAKSNKKYFYKQKEDGGEFMVETTGFRGQWGITQDDIGNIYASGNTKPWIGEQIAYEYLIETGLIHDDLFSFQPHLEENFKEVWPIVGTTDAQGGPGLLRKEDNTLKTFTAAGGQTIFRGNKLGENMIGQYFIPEPVGRLVRRSIITEENGYRKLINPLKSLKKEFIASTDPNFRPVNTFTGPDGCLYIIDMYRGIIQESNWVRPGSYLYEEILRKKLHKNVQRGRIYRISKDGIKPDNIPKFDSFSNDQLINALAHPNGWWRDEAQKRLVLAQNKSVINKLKKMVLSEKSSLGRVHAIWTLKGLNSFDKKTAEISLNDSSWKVQHAAVRASENIILTDLAFLNSLKNIKPRNEKVAKQLILSLGMCNSLDEVNSDKKEVASLIIQKIAMDYPKNELILLAAVASLSGKEEDFLSFIIDEGDSIKNIDLWVKILTRVIIKSSDVTEIKKILNKIVKSPAIYQSIFLEGLAEALPKSGRGTLSRVPLIRFNEKPSSIKVLENNFIGSQSLKKAMIWFTWPGESRFNKPHGTVDMANWEKNLYNRGRTIYKNLCASCHGGNGMGINIDNTNQLLAPALAGNSRVEGDPDKIIKILLHGQVGPIRGQTYSSLMAPMESYDDEWLGSVITYIRRSWGNVGESVPHHHVKRIRDKNKDRNKPWTDAELNK